MRALVAIARMTLSASVLAMCLLTFGWPFAVSTDPSHPVFKVAAIATLLAFLLSLAVLLACKLRRT